MRRLRNPICILLIMLFMAGFLSACYDRREVDDLAYVIAIGIDKGKIQNMKLTLQIAVPKSIGGGGGGGGGGEGDKGKGKEGVVTVTLETPTLYSGLNMANNSVSRQLNLSHAKLMVFSKEYAEHGVEDIMTALPRGREIRSNMQVAVSRGSAEEFLKSIKPKLEVNPTKYYELMFKSYTYTGFSAPTDFFNFHNKLKSLDIEAVAALVGVSRFGSLDNFDSKYSTAGEKGRDKPMEGDFKAGDIPKAGDVESEVMGLAIFKAGKMVGELDGEEATFYTMVNGEFNHAYITARDPIEKDKFAILDTKQSRKPQQKIKIINGKPQLSVRVFLEADIQAIQSGRNYEDPKSINILEKDYEDYLGNGITRLLNKTSKDYAADICGFGQHIKVKFLTWQEWKDFKWLSKYKDSSFKVEVDLKIRRPGLMVRSAPAKEE